MHENVSTKVAKTYTFVTEVIKNTVEMARSIAEVISMRASATPTWMKKIQKNLGGKKSPARAGTKEMVNRISVSSGKSEPKVTGAALCGAER